MIALLFPPFTNLVRIVFTSKDEKIAQNTADNFKKSILKILPKNYEVFSVTACGRHKIKDNFRYQLLIKGKFSKYLSEALKTVRKDFKFSKNFKILIDIDPTSTFF